MSRAGVAAVFIGIVLLVLLFGPFMGWLASVVLRHFGVDAPWYICWAAIVVLGVVFRGGRTIVQKGT